MFKSLLFSALLALSTVVNAADVSPLQPAHNGLWFDPTVSNVLVQVYPFVQGNPETRSAVYVVNYITESSTANPDKSWLAFLVSDFRGFARTSNEDTFIGTDGQVGQGRTTWTLSSSGSTCSELKLVQIDGEGAVLSTLNLQRIVGNNSSVGCYTCPSPAAGPFPPMCVR